MLSVSIVQQKTSHRPTV